MIDAGELRSTWSRSAGASSRSSTEIPFDSIDVSVPAEVGCRDFARTIAERAKAILVHEEVRKCRRERSCVAGRDESDVLAVDEPVPRGGCGRPRDDHWL